MINRLNQLLPCTDESHYERIEQKIKDMLNNGTVIEAIIATSARLQLKKVRLIENYQNSPEWEKFYWGNRFVILEGKRYFITYLRDDKEDFNKYPFYAYEVVGVKKLRFKRKCNIYSDYGASVKITWHGIKVMQPMATNSYVKTTAELITKSEK